MDSDDETEYYSWKGVPGTIVLLNVFNPTNIETPAICHVATCRLMRHLLRIASSHYFGVCLYGTDEVDPSKFGTQNICQICPLTLPNLDDFQKLESTDLSSYKQAQELVMSDALRHCTKMFANCSKQLLSRTVLILSKLDVPPTQKDQKATLSIVKEMYDSNIEIKLINISNHDYSPDQFYEYFLMEANQNKHVTLPKCVWDYKDIVSSMHTQSHRHLAIAQLEFEIGEGFGIGVSVYSLHKSNYQTKKSNLDRDTNDVVTSVTKTTKVSTESTQSTGMEVDGSQNEPTELPLLKSELLHCQYYGEEKQVFTDKEKKSMSNPFGPPMIKLLGFKPERLISKEKWYFKPGYFLYPNENEVEGSTKAFKALYKACVDMSVVAVCVLCTRVNARPYIVALSPSSQPLGLNVKIGFDIIRIPFMENVRQLSLEKEEESTDIHKAHKTVMKDIIKQLTFDYMPTMFENPKIQSEYRAIEVIALGDVDMEPFIDTTKQKPELYQALQEDVFEEIFGPFGVMATKRVADKKPAINPKKVKVEDEVDEDDFQNRLRNKKLNTYTVVQLKHILNDKNIEYSIQMKKNDLVNLVYQHLDAAS